VVGKVAKAASRLGLLHGLGEKIVRFDGDRQLLRRLGLLHARRIEREHLQVDAGRVHLGDTLVADVLKLLAHPDAARPPVAQLCGEILARTREESRADKVLFKGNGSHGRSVWSFGCAASGLVARPIVLRV